MRRKVGNLYGDTGDPAEVHPSDGFRACWLSASKHLGRHPEIRFVNDGLVYPIFEHFQFEVGNQLFFVRVEDANDGLYCPGSLAALQELAEECGGHACILPMRRRLSQWVAHGGGWGLFDSQTGTPVDPLSLVTDERIEMSDWEIQSLAVRVARDEIRKSGREVIPWNAHPGSDPSIWIGPKAAAEWVVVRGVRYPTLTADFPSDWDEIAAACAHQSDVGYCVSVSFLSGEDAHTPDDIPTTPLWRGEPVLPRIDWLTPPPN